MLYKTDAAPSAPTGRRDTENAQWAEQSDSPRDSLLRRIQSPYAVAIVVGLIYLALLVWLWGHFNGDPLGFVHRGTVYSEGNPAGTRGYDGQFYYYTAADPWNAAKYMDNATFRLQRVFYPLVIIAVSLGQKALIPYAMIAIVYLSVVGSTLLVALLLARWGRSPWFALGYALCSGIPVAITFDTAEPLTFALVALGIFLWDRADPHINRSARSGDASSGAEPPAEDAGLRKAGYWPLMVGGTLAFAAALLTRELALYFVVGYAAVALYRAAWESLPGLSQGGRFDGVRSAMRRHGPPLLLSILAFLPLVLWSAYLSFTSGYLGVSFAQPFEYIPFLAYWLQLVNPNLRSLGYAGQYILPTVVFGALGIWQLLRNWKWPSPLLIAMLGNVHLMTFLPRLGYQHQVAVSRYILGLALAAVLWAASTRPRWVLWLALLFALSFLVYFYGLVRQDPAFLW